jgi:hypothetical protein
LAGKQGVRPNNFSYFFQLFNFGRFANMHVAWHKQLAFIGAITKKDAKKPTIGFCVFESCGKFNA